MSKKQKLLSVSVFSTGDGITVNASIDDTLQSALLDMSNDEKLHLAGGIATQLYESFINPPKPRKSRYEWLQIGVQGLYLTLVDGEPKRIICTVVERPIKTSKYGWVVGVLAGAGERRYIQCSALKKLAESGGGAGHG